MNEAETRAELIDPALKAAGWGVVEGSRIRREYGITLGRLQGAGRRARGEVADYVLIYRNHKLAVVEAKARDKPITEGLDQAKRYAGKMRVRHAISTNGIGVYQADMQTGQEGDITGFPTPEELWNETYAEENAWRDRFAAVPFEDKGGTWQSRYYQDIAIDRTLEAIAHRRDRILLTLATGTGKTFIAFQLAWKLFHSRWNLSREATRRPRILFLADRIILADQGYNAFSAFQEDALVRIDPQAIRKKGRVPKNGSIFFTIFQTFMSGPEETPYFGEYPPDFFDFIVIDECHRGGASDESRWRGILEYFSPAVQLGLTATPKRDDNVDTYAYFGEPVYIYSLKEGINDGFLTPFKVKQFTTSLDEYIYTPDDDVIEGEVEEARRYTESDFNRIIEMKEREQYRVKLFMDQIDQREKTLVFCANQSHAAAVRDLINQMTTSTDPNYCVRVTANDGKRGEQWLREFQDNEKTIPTILTTSHKLSIGVDARNIRNIVLLRQVTQIIEFKQIIGRGTRLYDGKDYFTIYDFVKAYEHCLDPDWDGEPIEPVPKDKTGSDGEEHDDSDGDGPESDDPPRPPRQRIKVKLADGKARHIQHIMVTSFWGPDGKPVSAAQFLEALFGTLPDFFKDEEELRRIWSLPETRKALLDGLAEKGFGRDAMEEMQRIIDADKSDLFDVLAFVAFALPTRTREERAGVARARIQSEFDDRQQAFLDFVLAQYVKVGVDELDQGKLVELIRLKYHNTRDAVRELGDVPSIRQIFIGFQRLLYLSETAV